MYSVQSFVAPGPLAAHRLRLIEPTLSVRPLSSIRASAHRIVSSVSLSDTFETRFPYNRTTSGACERPLSRFRSFFFLSNDTVAIATASSSSRQIFSSHVLTEVGERERGSARYKHKHACSGLPVAPDRLSSDVRSCATYHDAASSGLVVHVRASNDGVGFNTEDLATFELPPRPGERVSATFPVNASAMFVKVLVENSDSARPGSDIAATAVLACR